MSQTGRGKFERKAKELEDAKFAGEEKQKCLQYQLQVRRQDVQDRDEEIRQLKNRVDELKNRVDELQRLTSEGKGQLTDKATENEQLSEELEQYKVPECYMFWS
jgi:chromosome segregation ATPase